MFYFNVVKCVREQVDLIKDEVHQVSVYETISHDLISNMSIVLQRWFIDSHNSLITRATLAGFSNYCGVLGEVCVSLVPDVLNI